MRRRVPQDPNLAPIRASAEADGGGISGWAAQPARAGRRLFGNAVRRAPIKNAARKRASKMPAAGDCSRQRSEGSSLCQGDRGGNRAFHAGDARGRALIHATENNDACVVRLIAVVEDEVGARSVVANVRDVWVRTGGLAIEREGLRQTSGLLDPSVIAHLQRHRKLSNQVLAGCAPVERHLESLFADGDADACRSIRRSDGCRVIWYVD